MICPSPLNPGTIHSIIGPNGAGKTTLFNLITGVYTPTNGTILYDDEGVTGFANHMSWPRVA